MAKYAALLRGVNVGGITVTSADLAELFRSLGFSEVKTVLASGNVLFSTSEAASSTAHARLKATIEKGLGERFGYDAWIVLVDHGELAGIVDAYPFEETDGTQPYVLFASTQDALDEIAAFVAASAGERGVPGHGVFYWETPKGSSTETALAKFLAKPRFKASTTTRNLRTLRKLL
ncbi:DUF1697 domain-containing protein [Herbiconiux sp. CPCC 203407]|uniref:DUF1697 domain-containing protein n=1 Tax=Herbiconiux oxytropis TaxID=2970915 RepID=A0AA42BWV7_9MICO|nr:DUF1697 domain-containing protein [Herbiconiux oxytropis]MCS5722305.1 DUF1697 domain-containing protein [Herbiconiux oxytropis]MCS5727298.1 DUF1697 domain-containing protein [Herbiconiux oxytropis]